MNSRQIRGDAQIVNPETGEPYTWQQYDWEQGKYVDQPVTMGMVVQEIEKNYADLMMRTQNLENELQKLANDLEELRNK